MLGHLMKFKNHDGDNMTAYIRRMKDGKEKSRKENNYFVCAENAD